MNHTSDLRKFINEARRLGDPNIEYVDKPKVKKEPENIDRVIAKMKGSPSGFLTRIANRFRALKEAEEELAKQKQRMSVSTKKVAKDYFNVEDEVYTRVIETLRFTITLSKQETKEPQDIKKFDVEGFYKELLDLMPELGEMLEELREKYTEIQTTEPKKPEAKLRVTHKDELGPATQKKNLGEALEDVDDFYTKLREWDQEFARLKKKYEQEV